MAQMEDSNSGAAPAKAEKIFNFVQFLRKSCPWVIKDVYSLVDYVKFEGLIRSVISTDAYITGSWLLWVDISDEMETKTENNDIISEPMICLLDPSDMENMDSETWESGYYVEQGVTYKISKKMSLKSFLDNNKIKVFVTDDVKVFEDQEEPFILLLRLFDHNSVRKILEMLIDNNSKEADSIIASILGRVQPKPRNIDNLSDIKTISQDLKQLRRNYVSLSQVKTKSDSSIIKSRKTFRGHWKDAGGSDNTNSLTFEELVSGNNGKKIRLTPMSQREKNRKSMEKQLKERSNGLSNSSVNISGGNNTLINCASDAADKSAVNSHDSYNRSKQILGNRTLSNYMNGIPPQPEFSQKFEPSAEDDIESAKITSILDDPELSKYIGVCGVSEHDDANTILQKIEDYKQQLSDKQIEGW